MVARAPGTAAVGSLEDPGSGNGDQNALRVTPKVVLGVDVAGTYLAAAALG